MKEIEISNLMSSTLKLIEQEKQTNQAVSFAQSMFDLYVSKYSYRKLCDHVVDGTFEESDVTRILFLLGNTNDLDTESQNKLIAWGLLQESVVIRAICIQMIENWGDFGLAQKHLRKHEDTTDWVMAYARLVYHDLSNRAMGDDD